MPPPPVRIELRDGTVTRRQMTIDPRDILSATLTVRERATGAWALTIRESAPAAELLQQPGWGIVASVRGSVYLSGSTTSAQLVQSAQDPAGTVTIAGLDDMSILDDVLCWPSPSTVDLTAQNGSASQPGYDVRTGPAETVMRAYVNANIVAAPAARRPVGTLHTYLTLAADGARGTTVTGSGRWQTLTDMLQGLALAGGVSYRVTWIADGVLRLTFYVPRDLTNSVRLSVGGAGNAKGGISQLTYAWNGPAATYAIVGGAGDDTARLYSGVSTTNSRVGQALWHRYRERLVDDSSADPVELAQAGVTNLADDGKTQTSLSVDLDDAYAGTVIGGKMFGRDYGIGDTVSVVVRANPTAPTGQIAETITEATCTIDQAGYRIKATVGTPTAVTAAGGDPVLALLLRTIRTTQAQARRVSALERRR
jgi:hypothetical protein